MAKYRKKPVVVDAERWDGEATTADRVLGDRYGIDWQYLPDTLDIEIPTLEGLMRCAVGDWIITGVKGEHYPCKPDIFALTYEAAQED